MSGDRSAAPASRVAQPACRIERGRPRLAPGFAAERSGRRRARELAPVLVAPESALHGRVVYWTFGGISDERHREQLARGRVTYDLTVMADEPLGPELPKTHGHVHRAASGGDAGYAEMYEVLEGHAGFLVQDLWPGPVATVAALITVHAGKTVVIPPRLHHAVINLGPGTLVIGDVISRASVDDYGLLRAARGMAYYVGVDGRTTPNASYAQVPPLARFESGDWSAGPSGSLYEILVEHPADLDWLSVADRLWYPTALGFERRA